MERAIFKKEDQIKFIELAKQRSNLPWASLAKLCNIRPRTFFDWRRGKYHMSQKAFKTLSGLYKISNISPLKFLPQYREMGEKGRLGGLAFVNKYGIIGNLESRQKGGRISQMRRKLHPELYPKCINTFRRPKKSSELSEFVGIILGDGGITNYQVRITLPKKDDHYIKFVVRLTEKLFKIKPARYFSKKSRHQNVCNVTINGVNFVNYLESIGLSKGNKVVKQISSPLWIKKNFRFSKSCLRGLMDTDGCIYSHNHTSHGKEFFNIGMCFSNHAVPLRQFVFKTLQKLNFNPKYSGHGVYLYREDEVKRYFKEIRTHNPNNYVRLIKFLKRKGARVAESASLEARCPE